MFGFDAAKRTMAAIIDGSEPIVKAVMQPNGYIVVETLVFQVESGLE